MARCDGQEVVGIVHFVVVVDGDNLVALLANEIDERQVFFHQNIVVAIPFRSLPPIDIAGDEDVVGISTQVVDDSEIEGYYSVNGTKLAVPVQGTNIVKYKNGMTKKIFIK